MSIITYIKNKLYNIIKLYRYSLIEKLVTLDGKTLLDIGCQDLSIYNHLKNRYDITLADLFPNHKLIKKEDIQDLSFKNKSFDIVLCQEVLEHVEDPIKAISELKRITKKQLIISVPNEPFFTFFRFMVWEKEHLWAITPSLLKTYFGKPVYENKVFFHRYYIAVWRFDKDNS